ncbi:hypothetical protein BT96DRAFT_1005429 [Gymnopus androsaceus JB14]|uniref:CCHC-type domain-containing protein n=1 Tax=Gymnopus androsaceus JB14 TaxID=1447944 RepID=A0A6A4GMX7_9AGAR|nr:hypothetical protein BT96DRAFT_1005429 [Gymnopus androsaceus JB14]
MSTNPSNVSIPRFPKDNQLDGDRNWHTYKHECILALKARSLLQYVEGKIIQPLQSISQTTQTTTPTQTQIWSSTPLYKEWVAQDATATSIIVTNIRDPVGVGVEDDKSSAVIWKFLTDKYEKQVEQQIHLADTALRSHTYKPETMGEHVTIPQFRLIVIASLPLDWKQDTRSVPSTSSEDAFTFLHSLYLEKQQERESSERDKKRVKALLASQNTTAAAVEPQRAGRNSNLVCSNCGKCGHTVHRCWAKGGGAEGEGPKNWRVRRPNNNHAANNSNVLNNVNAAAASVAAADPEPSQLFVLSADSMGRSHTRMPNTSPDKTSSRHEPALVIERSDELEELAGICRDLPIHCKLVPSMNKCSACHGNTSFHPKTYIDSGATQHCWVSRNDFITFAEVVGQKGSSAIAGDAG